MFVERRILYTTYDYSMRILGIYLILYLLLNKPKIHSISRCNLLGGDVSSSTRNSAKRMLNSRVSSSSVASPAPRHLVLDSLFFVKLFFAPRFLQRLLLSLASTSLAYLADPHVS